MNNLFNTTFDCVVSAITSKDILKLIYEFFYEFYIQRLLDKCFRKSVEYFNDYEEFRNTERKSNYYISVKIATVLSAEYSVMNVIDFNECFNRVNRNNQNYKHLQNEFKKRTLEIRKFKNTIHLDWICYRLDIYEFLNQSDHLRKIITESSILRLLEVMEKEKHKFTQFNHKAKECAEFRLKLYKCMIESTHKYLNSYSFLFKYLFGCSTYTENKIKQLFETNKNIIRDFLI